MSYQHRIYRPDGSFWVHEFRDDTTRTVTTYNESGNVIDTRPYTEAENAAADAAQAAQADAAAQVDKIAAIEAAVLATVDRTPKPWHPVTGAHDAAAPLSEWTMDDGHAYRNISGQWLSHSPYEYPRGYECLDCPEPEPDPDTGVLPWTDKGSPSYKTGDLRTWPDGSSTVYRCRQDHTAHEGAGFNPSVASLWEIVP